MWRCLNTAFEQWRPVSIPVPGTRYAHCFCTTAVMLLNQAADLCLAVQNNTDTRPVGTPVVAQPCDEFDEKQWWLLNELYHESGDYIPGGPIRAFTVFDKVLDVQGAKTANGTPLQVYPENRTDAQVWGPPAGKFR
jgi:hypothetical protein